VTCFKVQGDTITKKFAVAIELRALPTVQALYVLVTRTRRLADLWFFGVESFPSEGFGFNKDIAANIRQFRRVAEEQWKVWKPGDRETGLRVPRISGARRRAKDKSALAAVLGFMGKVTGREVPVWSCGAGGPGVDAVWVLEDQVQRLMEAARAAREAALREETTAVPEVVLPDPDPELPEDQFRPITPEAPKPKLDAALSSGSDDEGSDYADDGEDWAEEEEERREEVPKPPAQAAPAKGSPKPPAEEAPPKGDPTRPPGLMADDARCWNEIHRVLPLYGFASRFDMSAVVATFLAGLAVPAVARALELFPGRVSQAARGLWPTNENGMLSLCEDVGIEVGDLVDPRAVWVKLSAHGRLSGVGVFKGENVVPAA
jgi:hypothetical protein